MILRTKATIKRNYSDEFLMHRIKTQDQSLARFKMASKQVINNCRPLLNSKFKNSNLTPSDSLLPRSNQPFLVFKSSEMTQAATISPTGVRPRAVGPCSAPTLTCPPPPCACPPPPKVVSLTTRVLRAICNLAKLGLFVGVTKFTIDEGLWGDSEQTEDLAKRMGIISEDKGEQKEESKSSFTAMWDSLVLKVGEFFGLEA